MKPDFAIAPQRMGWFKRHPSQQVRVNCHRDRGGQYASRDYRDALVEYCITASMSRRGDCSDNAWSERRSGH